MLRAFQVGNARTSDAGPYADFQGGFDSTVPHGWHYYWKGTTLPSLTDEAIAVIADHAFAAGSRARTRLRTR